MITDSAQEIVTAAGQELGLGPINMLNIAGDENGYQILGQLNALGDEILRSKDWQNLESTMTFTGDGVVDTFALPANYGRQVNQTEWSVSSRRPLLGPASPQVWSWYQYGIIGAGGSGFYRYRIINSEYSIFPVPADGEEFALYYISKNWVYDPIGLVYKSKVTLSTDIPQFDRRIMIAGLKVKFWAQKGFKTTVVQKEYNDLLKAEMAQNQGARVIDLSGASSPYLLNWGNIQQGSWNT